MFNAIITQIESPIEGILAHGFIFLIVAYGLFIANLYIFRSIFNIPRFLRCQKAQLRILEEIAKNQGVDNTKIANIISESDGWSVSSQQARAPQSTTAN